MQIKIKKLHIHCISNLFKAAKWLDACADIASADFLTNKFAVKSRAINRSQIQGRVRWACESSLNV
jgi:hypothetical protein